MPTFSTLPIGEARARSATGKRAALLQEYVGYIQRVTAGEAGKLEGGEGETPQAERGCDRAGKEPGVPPHGQRGLLLVVGGTPGRQAPQELGRVTVKLLPFPSPQAGGSGVGVAIGQIGSGATFALGSFGAGAVVAVGAGVARRLRHSATGA